MELMRQLVLRVLGTPAEYTPGPCCDDHPAGPAGSNQLVITLNTHENSCDAKNNPANPPNQHGSNKWRRQHWRTTLADSKQP
jgi:hypothetical protein